MKPQGTFASAANYSLLFFIAPFSILMLGKVLFELLAFKFPELNHSLIEYFSTHQELQSVINFKEAKARMLWITSVIVYLFVSVVFFSLVWYLLKKSLTKQCLLLFASIALICSLAEILYLALVEKTTSPLATIFSFTYESLTACGLYSAGELKSVFIILSFINILAVLIPYLGIITGCGVMRYQQSYTESRLDNLLVKSKYIKELLIAGSVVMVIGIAHMQLWLSWPISLIQDSSLAEQIDAILLTVSQYWGVIYTLAMTALYLPIAFSLSEQARMVIQTSSDEDIKKHPDRWLEENKMLVSPSGQLPQLIAVIAPMLVGSFGSALGNIMPF